MDLGILAPEHVLDKIHKSCCEGIAFFLMKDLLELLGLAGLSLYDSRIIEES